MTARVAHLIVGLEVGGAEKMLLSLVRERPPGDVVISMTDGGALAPDFVESGIRVESLGMRPGSPDPRGFQKLRHLLTELRPGVLQTWMYHADLLGGLAAGVVPVVWCVQAVDIERDGMKLTTRATRALCARLSRRLPERIVYCAESGARFHSSIGYAADKAVVIPNAVDVSLFAPDPDAAGSLRKELGLDPYTELIGMAARFHPQKDHRNFARAAGALGRKRPQTGFLLCGRGIDRNNNELVSWLGSEGVLDRTHLLGERHDTSRILAGLDVVTLSSAFGEASPVVLAEAMACGTVCVVTDVGDSAAMVGESGLSVLPRDPEALASAWEAVLALPAHERRRWSGAARQRATERFSITSAARAYERVYEDVLD